MNQSTSLALTARGAEILPVQPDLPRASPALASVMRDMLTPHPNYGSPRRIAGAIREEAQGRLAVLSHLCQPAPLAMVATWFLDITMAVKNPPSEKEFTGRVQVIYDAVAVNLPWCCWTVDAKHAAMRVWTFFPTPAAVNDFFVPLARPLQNERAALRLIVETPVEGPPPQQLSMEEREAVSAEFWRKWREAGLRVPPSVKLAGEG